LAKIPGNKFEAWKLAIFKRFTFLTADSKLVGLILVSEPAF
jgi:hypothetical protein